MRFLYQAALNDCPEAGRYGRAKRARDFAHDCRTDLEAGAPCERKTSRGCFIKHNAECPQIAAMVGDLAAQDFGRHVGQSATDAGGILALWRKIG